jgi:hypothetical protein
LTLALVAILGLTVSSWAKAGPPEQLVFERLNRTFSGIADELAPVEVGPARVELRSPNHALELHRHLVSMTVAPEGGHRIVLELRVSGWGEIEADVTVGSIETTLSDHLTLPEQSVLLAGRAAIVRGEGGYNIAVFELPETVTVAIESQLAQRLFRVCRPMGLVLVALDCPALERSLSQIVVSLPKPGSTYFLADEELAPADRVELDRYLSAQ